jgi:hypothetical protein
VATRAFFARSIKEGFMRPYRTSMSARLASGAAAFALAAGGLTAVLQLPWIALPVILVVTILSGILACLFAIEEHPGAAIALGIGLPLALWAYVLALLVAINHMPRLGWLFLGMSALVVAQALVATFITLPDEVRTETRAAPTR